MLLHHCECGGLDAACVKTVHETLRAVSVGKINHPGSVGLVLKCIYNTF